MDKFGAAASLALTIALASPTTGTAVVPALSAAVLGPDAAACRSGSPHPAALVRVHGFKDAVGGLRIQLYSDLPDDFLTAGKKLRRVELPVTTTDPVSVCVELPSPGRFAVAVLHDRDGDHKLSIWRDGVGFSNNPKIRLGKPDLSEVLFDAGSGTAEVDVVLNYRSGFAVRPLAGR